MSEILKQEIKICKELLNWWLKNTTIKTQNLPKSHLDWAKKYVCLPWEILKMGHWKDACLSNGFYPKMIYRLNPNFIYTPRYTTRLNPNACFMYLLELRVKYRLKE